MSFHLRVKFLGPCLFVVHDSNGTTNEVTVLMPDARRSKHPNLKHPDKSDAKPHLGFIRLDLAQLNKGFAKAASTGDDPSYEFVHRFDGEELEFVTGTGGEIQHLSKLAFPNFDHIAPKKTRFGVEPIVGFLDNQPPDAVLMRTRLRGGHFESKAEETWWVSNLNPDGNEHSGKFARDVTWISPPIERLIVKIRKFDQSQSEVTFPLTPAADEQLVTVTVGNLCGENPLGWKEVAEEKDVRIDEDFKWLYWLLRTEGKSELDLPHEHLPIPTRREKTSEEPCMGGRITVASAQAAQAAS